MVIKPVFAERSFGEIHFGGAKLGNKARTERLVVVADALVKHPGGTLPEKVNDPMALQALYRLVKRPEVTHASVLETHQAETFRRIDEDKGPLLAISDATELDYNGLKTMTDLGQIGNGSRRGYVCQNLLIVDPEQKRAVGLANQILRTRVKAPPGESKEQIRHRKSRESLLWPQVTKPLPNDAKLVVVCDRGADTFEELEHEARSGRRFVIRSSKDRKVMLRHSAHGATKKLYTVGRSVKAAGEYTLDVDATADRAARKATLQYSFIAVRLLPPKQPRGEHSQEPLPVWVVRVWESDPPQGVAPLEWFLLTNEPVKLASQARQVIGWYECRWVVEEYHKAQKTGCCIEQMQFTHASRMEPMIALQSVVALTLLNLRDAARRPDAHTKPANEIVWQDYVKVLSMWRHGEVRPNWSVHEFFLALARLGGHQNRRGDKRPGWLVLWRGWTDLQFLAIGWGLKDPRKEVG